MELHQRIVIGNVNCAAAITATSATFTGGDINIATSGKKLLFQGNRMLDATNTTTQSTYVGINAGGASTTGVQNTCVGQASGGNLTSWCTKFECRNELSSKCN